MKIFVAVNDSESSWLAFNLSLRLTGISDTLTVVHVVLSEQDLLSGRGLLNKYKNFQTNFEHQIGKVEFVLLVDANPRSAVVDFINKWLENHIISIGVLPPARVFVGAKKLICNITEVLHGGSFSSFISSKCRCEVIIARSFDIEAERKNYLKNDENFWKGW